MNSYIEITVINKVKTLKKFIGFTHNVCKNLNDVAENDNSYCVLKLVLMWFIVKIYEITDRFPLKL